MEDRSGEANWNCDVLKRIVALLFALAHLADLAAGLPLLRRRQVLGILSHGEAEARAFVIDMATGDSAPADSPEEVRDAPGGGDAARLAASFRVLAFTLFFLLTHGAPPALPGATGPQAGRPSHGMSGTSVRWPSAPTPTAPDTS